MIFPIDAIESDSLLEMVPDALEPDRDDDARTTVSRRALVRLVLVATEVAARFEREASDVDPVAWMLAPRRLHAGRAPLDACLELDECTRALLLHGLGLGLDADRADFDEALLDDAPVRLEEAA